MQHPYIVRSIFSKGWYPPDTSALSTLTPVLPGHDVQPERAGVGLQAAPGGGLPGEAGRGRATGLGEGACTS